MTLWHPSGVRGVPLETGSRFAGGPADRLPATVCEPCGFMSCALHRWRYLHSFCKHPSNNRKIVRFEGGFASRQGRQEENRSSRMPGLRFNANRQSFRRLRPISRIPVFASVSRWLSLRLTRKSRRGFDRKKSTAKPRQNKGVGQLRQFGCGWAAPGPLRPLREPSPSLLSSRYRLPFRRYALGNLRVHLPAFLVPKIGPHWFLPRKITL